MAVSILFSIFPIEPLYNPIIIVVSNTGLQSEYPIETIYVSVHVRARAVHVVQVHHFFLFFLGSGFRVWGSMSSCAWQDPAEPSNGKSK